MGNKNYDAIIIGGGACGLMCAVQAGYVGKRTLILEKNEKLGAKILISGGGRCNYTNLVCEPENFISENPHFIKSALNAFTSADTIQFFETYGIFGKEKTLGQIFPENNNAKDIVALFDQLCKDLGQDVVLNSTVKNVIKNGDLFEVSYVKDDKQYILQTTKLVVCTGGLPIAKLGATDFALKLAHQFGLKTTPTFPALVPLTITGKDLDWYSKLSGNSVFAEVWNERITFRENILFTHWGLSGPAILQISSYWKAGEIFNINLLPDKNIIELIENERLQNGKKLLGNYLSLFYTKKFIEALSVYLPTDKNLASLNKADLNSIQQFIHQFSVKAAGTKGYDKAEVMKGGISTEELSSKTLESKKVSGLFFGGECVDITGWLGGYNFQWAWASGYIIAQNI